MSLISAGSISLDSTFNFFHRLLLQRSVSLYQCMPSPDVLNCILRLFLWRQILEDVTLQKCSFSPRSAYGTFTTYAPNDAYLRAFSYEVAFHSVHSPTALKEIRRRRKKMTLWKIPVWKKAQIHSIKILQSAPKGIIQALLRDSKLSWIGSRKV